MISRVLATLGENFARRGDTQILRRKSSGLPLLCVIKKARNCFGTSLLFTFEFNRQESLFVTIYRDKFSSKQHIILCKTKGYQYEQENHPTTLYKFLGVEGAKSLGERISSISLQEASTHRQIVSRRHFKLNQEAFRRTGSVRSYI